MAVGGRLEEAAGLWAVLTGGGSCWHLGQSYPEGGASGGRLKPPCSSQPGRGVWSLGGLGSVHVWLRRGCAVVSLLSPSATVGHRVALSDVDILWHCSIGGHQAAPGGRLLLSLPHGYCPFFKLHTCFARTTPALLPLASLCSPHGATLLAAGSALRLKSVLFEWSVVLSQCHSFPLF